VHEPKLQHHSVLHRSVQPGRCTRTMDANHQAFVVSQATPRPRTTSTPCYAATQPMNFREPGTPCQCDRGREWNQQCLYELCKQCCDAQSATGNLPYPCTAPSHNSGGSSQGKPLPQTSQLSHLEAPLTLQQVARLGLLSGHHPWARLFPPPLKNLAVKGTPSGRRMRSSDVALWRWWRVTAGSDRSLRSR